MLIRGGDGSQLNQHMFGDDLVYSWGFIEINASGGNLQVLTQIGQIAMKKIYIYNKWHGEFCELGLLFL